MTRIRLMWVSDSPTCPTGMGTVGRHLLKRLNGTSRYEILARGAGFQGEAYDPVEYPYPIEVSAPDNSDANAMVRALERFLPQVTVIFGDVWRYLWLTALYEMRETHWVGYYPLDSGPIMRSCVPVLQRTEINVACAYYGQELMAEAVPDKPVEMIYLGVDTGVYRPLHDETFGRRDGEAEILGSGISVEGSDGPREGERSASGSLHPSSFILHPSEPEFVVGFVGRNQPRKQIPVLIKAFARFCRDKPDAFLYLHTAPRDAGWDLPELIERYGIKEQCAISYRATSIKGISDEEMNSIYNSMDVFVLPSNGEGFGMPILEAMAAGVPVVVTDSSASRELAMDRGERIRVAHWSTACQGNVEIAYPDEDDLVQILERLYRDPERRRQMAKRGREFAEQLDWDCIAAQWDALLQKVAEMPYYRDPAEWKR